MLQYLHLFYLENKTLAPRPVESQLGPWGYKQHGPLYRSSSAGARGGFSPTKILFSSPSELNFLRALLETRVP